jgi:hypothetical protein
LGIVGTLGRVLCPVVASSGTGTHPGVRKRHDRYWRGWVDRAACDPGSAGRESVTDGRSAPSSWVSAEGSHRKSHSRHESSSKTPLDRASGSLPDVWQECDGKIVPFLRHKATNRRPAAIVADQRHCRTRAPSPRPASAVVTLTATFMARWLHAVPIHVPCSGIASRGSCTTATRTRF